MANGPCANYALNSQKVLPLAASLDSEAMTVVLLGSGGFVQL